MSFVFKIARCEKAFGKRAAKRERAAQIAVDGDNRFTRPGYFDGVWFFVEERRGKRKGKKKKRKASFGIISSLSIVFLYCPKCCHSHFVPIRNPLPRFLLYFLPDQNVDNADNRLSSAFAAAERGEPWDAGTECAGAPLAAFVPPLTASAPLPLTKNPTGTTGNQSPASIPFPKSPQ